MYKYGLRLRFYSSAASNVKRAGSNSRSGGGAWRRNAAVAVGSVGVLYAGGLLYSLKDESFREQFERLPFTRDVVDHLEEWQHQRRQRQSYEAREAETSTVTPYIFSRRPVTEEKADPLNGQKFFEMNSGQVGGSRDYLPLLLLPDVHDPQLNSVAEAMNDLISSANSNAVTREGLESVAQELTNLANSIKKSDMQFSHRFLELARDFRQLDPSDRTVLSAAILDAENDLVIHINSREYKEQPNELKTKEQKKKTATNKTKDVTKSTPYDASHSRYETILRLQVSLTLLISALHNHLSANPYILDVKEAVASYSPNLKETLIHDALAGLVIPQDVNLQPIITDIINS